jgi:hypothetical protein
MELRASILTEHLTAVTTNFEGTTWTTADYNALRINEDG